MSNGRQYFMGPLKQRLHDFALEVRDIWGLVAERRPDCPVTGRNTWKAKVYSVEVTRKSSHPIDFKRVILVRSDGLLGDAKDIALKVYDSAKEEFGVRGYEVLSYDVILNNVREAQTRLVLDNTYI